jgi:hypothetical protein
LAVSVSPTNARYALLFNAVQFLKTAGLRIWNFIEVQPPLGVIAPCGDRAPLFISGEHYVVQIDGIV